MVKTNTTDSIISVGECVLCSLNRNGRPCNSCKMNENQMNMCQMSRFSLCRWSNNFDKIEDHFKENHKDLIIANSSELELNIVDPYIKHYFVATLQKLFIIRIELKDSDKTLHFAVHLLYDPQSKISYFYDIIFQTQDNFIWTHPKHLIASDNNLLIRKNDYFLNLNILKTKLHQPTTIIFKIKIYINPLLVDQVDTIPIYIDETKNENDFEQLLKELECIVCQEQMIVTIFQCRTGHSVCGVCKPLLRKCPLCIYKIGPTRNYTLERVAGTIVDYINKQRNATKSCLKIFENNLNMKSQTKTNNENLIWNNELILNNDNSINRNMPTIQGDEINEVNNMIPVTRMQRSVILFMEMMQNLMLILRNYSLHFIALLLFVLEYTCIFIWFLAQKLIYFVECSFKWPIFMMVILFNFKILGVMIYIAIYFTIPVIQEYIYFNEAVIIISVYILIPRPGNVLFALFYNFYIICCIIYNKDKCEFLPEWLLSSFNFDCKEYN